MKMNTMVHNALALRIPEIIDMFDECHRRVFPGVTSARREDAKKAFRAELLGCALHVAWIVLPETSKDSDCASDFKREIDMALDLFNENATALFRAWMSENCPTIHPDEREVLGRQFASLAVS